MPAISSRRDHREKTITLYPLCSLWLNYSACGYRDCAGVIAQADWRSISVGRSIAVTQAASGNSARFASSCTAVRPILIAPERCEAALDSLPFACVRYTWRGARAVFDGLDDALA